jgi:hypothetical protein
LLFKRVNTTATERWSSLVEAYPINACVAKNRNDIEVSVKELDGGVYRIIEEAPHQIGNETRELWGYRNEAIVHIYNRGANKFLKLVELKKFRPVHPHSKSNKMKDGYIVESWSRGNKILPGSLEERILDWIWKEVNGN